ncbi:glycoside hydrolase [Pluteus cervinus]|uniref:Glycoside hydrolase n=1 Tax=Pluteus cervinus TaxID=181527 RepID=A0ACD3AWX1_9AGAR|nr:glycoside hydrolase [Pluteus cervinus]
MLSFLLLPALVALEQASARVVEPTATHLPGATVSGSALPTSSPTPVLSPNFPALGALPRRYQASDLERLWDVVGPVEPPPFTTTRVPQTPVALPSAPPALYPSWYSPAPKDLLPKYKFPKGFKFGVATAAYQVEGAVRDEGKGPTMWDWNSRQPGGVTDNTTGDVVDLHYFLYKEDVARIAALGVNAHSFSISWARIFPFGTADSPVNQAGLDHYSDLINYHSKLGVEPVATLFHWDVPLALQAYYGGFTSPNIVDDFVHYAKTVFRAYNGRVKTWYTFNEPRVYCGQLKGYPFNVNFAPGVNATSAPFHCAYNLLKAHAGAVKAFREMKIQGEISFKNDDYVGLAWRANNTEDAEAVERHAAFQIGIFSDPVYKGDWPQRMKDTLTPDVLPRFTEAEKKDILGSADFYAIDPYRTQYITAPSGGIKACVSDPSHELWPSCNTPVQYDSNAGWAAGWTPDPLMDWLQATPNFLVDSLKELKRRWPYKKIYVSEFGFAEPTEGSRTDLFRITEDFERTNYFMTYLGEILRGIHEENLPIAGAFAWAMVDNTEWSSGTSARFGIQYVNYTSLERHYKRSALALSEFWKAHN